MGASLISTLAMLRITTKEFMYISRRKRSALSILQAVALLALVAGASSNALAGPVASLSRVAIDYGNFPPDYLTEVEPVFITNIGDAPLTISGMSISGANASNFSVAGTCTPPLTLPPSARCRLDFTARATQAGSSFQFQVGTFSLQSDSSLPAPDVRLSILSDPTGHFMPPAPTPNGSTSQRSHWARARPYGRCRF